MFNTQIFENSNGGSASAINIPNQQSNDNLAVPQPIDITYQRNHSHIGNPRFRRESIAHSQGMGGVSWGSITIGSWLKDEVMMFGSGQVNGGNGGNGNANVNAYGNNGMNASNNMGFTNLINPRRGSFRHHQPMSTSPANHTSYMPELEADYCKDYSCCGELLPTLHDLLRHYEEAHISPSPPIEQNEMLVANRNKNNLNNMHNIMETVSTNDVFLNSNHNQMQQTTRLTNDLPIEMSQNMDVQIPQIGILRDNISQNNSIAGNLDYQQMNRRIPTDAKMFQQHHDQRQDQQIHPQQMLHINSQLQQSRSGTPRFDDDEAMYIDDPARHLYMMENNEHKPYRCPVIGCDKTYKNQNGLKYHRAHGHQNQKLKENPDGTISIIDPESNTPFLDGAGIEKDKPYRCELCGKRYKNLNGLKYHRGHTTH